ncbi:hypothetical protein [Kitasatospora sp. NPDC054795]
MRLNPGQLHLPTLMLDNRHRLCAVFLILSCFRPLPVIPAFTAS